MTTNGVAASPKTDRAQAQRQIGKRGLSIWGGFLSEEYLSALKPWANEVRVYLEMRDDTIIATLLDSVKMPLLAAPILTEPASDQHADAAAAEWLQQNLDSMTKQTLRSHTMDMLEALDFGFAIGEIILEKRQDGRLWLRNIEPRGQETLRRWIPREDGEPDDIVGFEQAPFRGASMLGIVRVPLDKCVHVTFRGRKGSPQGRALLRSLYGAWKFSKNFRVMEGIGVERDVGGAPVFTEPENSLSDGERSNVEEQLEGLRMDETVYAIIPHGAELKPYQSSAKAYNVREIIRDYDTLILMRFFAQFLKLGMDQVGARSLGEDSQLFFSLGLKAVQEEILEAWNSQLVPFLFKFNNFPGMTGLPKVTWADAGKVDFKAVLESVGSAVSAKVLTPQRDDEVQIREMLNLPELAKDEGWQDRSAPEPNPFMPFGGEEDTSADSGRGLGQPNGRGFALPDLRTKPGIYERFTNAYQRDLMTSYGRWANETARLAALPGRTAADLAGLIDGRLDDLRGELISLGQRRIGEAAGIGLGKPLAHRADSLAVQQVVSRMLDENIRALDESILPSIRERFTSDLDDVIRTGDALVRKQSVLDALASRRARLAGYAGNTWVTIFEAQKAAGSEENRDRRARGETPIRVRWVLDPMAEHCADDGPRATFGCPSLARVYEDGWDSMPTVPAGNTSCLGNCRCAIEADFGSGWQRIT
jgi:hypothetical protein